MRKIIIILLVLCLICAPSGPAFGANASDIESHWGNQVIKNWLNKGLITGYSDGTFRPDKAITRAEFMVMVNKAFNIEGDGSVHFSDVSETDWYYNAVRTAIHAGYIGGYPDGSIKPNHPISRQEAAAIITKITAIPQNPDSINQFSDSNLIAGWAKGFVGAVITNGYMSGYPMGTFKPTRYITRTEAVTVLNKVLTVQASDQEVTYDVAGVFGPKTGTTTIAKNVIVKADGVTLQNIVIKGSLIIAEEVGDGDVILNNISVMGETVIRGGGIDSIHINGGKYNKITMEKTSSGHVRIVTTNLEGLEFIISEAAEGEEIIIEGKFDSVAIEADDVNVRTQGETYIKELMIGEGARNSFVRLSDHSIITKLVANEKTVLQGQGTIREATGRMVDSSNFEKIPESIVGNTGGGNRIEIATVSVTGEAIVGTTLTAVSSPSAATVTYQWKISSDGVTYSNIPGSTASSYIPVNGDVGKFVKAEAMGIGRYKGSISSDATGPVIPARAQAVTASASALTMAAGEDVNIILTVRDGLGGIDTRYNGERTVTVSGTVPSPTASYGSFHDTELTADSMTGQSLPVTFTSGVAITSLSLHKATAQAITFNIDDVSAPAANPIVLTPVPASAAGIYLSADITAPEISGGLFGQQPVITLKDAYGNPCTNDSHTVVTASRKDGGDWALAGTKSVTALNGMVTFTDLRAVNVEGINGGQIAFTADGLPEVLSGAVTLPFHALSATATASALTPSAGNGNPVTLTVKDSQGNIATRFNGERIVTISGVTLSPFGSYGSFNDTELTADSMTGQSFPVTFTSGVAIGSLSLHKAAAQTITFNIDDVAAPAANPIVITPVPASAAGIYLLADITAPEISGGLFGQQPVLTLKDAYGNPCTNDSHTVVTASRKDGGDWTLAGTKSVTALNGMVTFTDLSAVNVEGINGGQIAFIAGSLPEILSGAVTLPFHALTATATASTLTPSAGNANPVTLTVKDSQGNIATRFNGERIVTISGVTLSPFGSYGSFNGTELTANSATTGQAVQVAFTNGTAIVNLSLYKASAQTISLRIADVAAPAANPVTVTPFPALAAGMYLTTDILAPAVNGGVFSRQPVITLKDAYGNLCANDSHTAVTASKKDGGTWTLTGGKTVTALNGLVRFTDLGATNAAQISDARMAFAASSLTEALSGTVTLPFYAQTATATTSTPAPIAGNVNPVTLTVKDASGNVDTTFNGTRAVTISGVDRALLGSYGTFNGAALTASSKTGQTINVIFTNGVAAPDLSLNKAATQTIAFQIAGVAVPGTNTIGITPVVADNISEGAISITDPGLQASGVPFQLGITLYDKYGNTAKNGTCTATVTSDVDGVLLDGVPVILGSGNGIGTVNVTLGTGGTHTLTVSMNSARFVPSAPDTVQIPVWDDASGWFILGDASGGGGGGGDNGDNGARGGNGGGNDDTLLGTAGADIIFGDGSGGGGGHQGSWGSASGAAGLGGGGNDLINGGLENDIIFGDGFNGANGWNSNRGGFGGGGGGGGGGNLNGNIGGQGGLAAGSGRGYSGNGAILVSGFGNVGNSVATATTKVGNGGSNGGSNGSGYGGGGGFGGGNGGSGGNYNSNATQGQDGNADPHAYQFSNSTIHDYTYGRLGNILASYPNYGSGNDVIDGGRGSDELFGLGGNDTFEFRLDASYSSEDIDTIWDFGVRGSDLIRLIDNGVEITPELYSAIIASQSAVDKDRTIVFSSGSGQQVTIVVKNLNRDLTAGDFGQ